MNISIHDDQSVNTVAIDDSVYVTIWYKRYTLEEYCSNQHVFSVSSEVYANERGWCNTAATLDCV